MFKQIIINFNLIGRFICKMKSRFQQVQCPACVTAAKTDQGVKIFNNQLLFFQQNITLDGIADYFLQIFSRQFVKL